MKKEETKPIAIVEWTDASMDHPHWQDMDLPDVPEPGSNDVVSTGFLVHNNKEWVVLLQTMGTGTCANSVEIPTRMVNSIKIIKE